MNWQRLAMILTMLNLVLLMFILAQVRPAVAQGVAPVLRGRALEIIDEQGRVRASLSVLPEDPNVEWKGKPYPEIVLLRLMSPDGSPHVKLGATKLGSALVIGGESKTYIQVLAEGGESTLTLINKDGVKRLIKP